MFAVWLRSTKRHFSIESVKLCVSWWLMASCRRRSLSERFMGLCGLKNECPKDYIACVSVFNAEKGYRTKKVFPQNKLLHEIKRNPNQWLTVLSQLRPLTSPHVTLTELEIAAFICLHYAEFPSGCLNIYALAQSKGYSHSALWYLRSTAIASHLITSSGVGIPHRILDHWVTNSGGTLDAIEQLPSTSMIVSHVITLLGCELKDVTDYILNKYIFPLIKHDTQSSCLGILPEIWIDRCQHAPLLRIREYTGAVLACRDWEMCLQIVSQHSHRIASRAKRRCIHRMVVAGQWLSALHHIVLPSTSPHTLADTMVKSTALFFSLPAAWSLLQRFSLTPQEHPVRRLATYHTIMAMSMRSGMWETCLEALSHAKTHKVSLDSSTCVLLLRLCGMRRATANMVVRVKSGSRSSDEIVLSTSVPHRSIDAWMMATHLYTAAHKLRKNIESSSPHRSTGTVPSAVLTQSSTVTIEMCLAAGQWNVATRILSNSKTAPLPDKTMSRLVQILCSASQWNAAMKALEHNKQLKKLQVQPEITKEINQDIIVNPKTEANEIKEAEGSEALTETLLRKVAESDWLSCIQLYHQSQHRGVYFSVNQMLDVCRVVAETSSSWVVAAAFITLVGKTQPSVSTHVNTVDYIVRSCAREGSWLTALHFLGKNKTAHNISTVHYVLLALLKIGYTHLTIQLFIRFTETNQCVAVSSKGSVPRMITSLVKASTSWFDAITILSGCFRGGVTGIPDSALVHCLQRLCEGDGVTSNQWKIAFTILNTLKLTTEEGKPISDDILSAAVQVCSAHSLWAQSLLIMKQYPQVG
eukprot:PhF_6_TR961/c0_g1_i2/m.1816